MGDHWIGSIQSTNLVHLEVTMQAFILAILPMVALAAHPAPAYGGYGPHYKCRDTNTSVYAEVCVPAFAQEVTPQVLDVKVVVDNDYCYNQIRTVCELTTQTVWCVSARVVADYRRQQLVVARCQVQRAERRLPRQLLPARI